jgi:hypothetical protein
VSESREADMALAIDVTAFNDVAVHDLVEPRLEADFRDAIPGHPWNDGTVSDETWRSMHNEYVNQFRRYKQDLDTIRWRDSRRAALDRLNATMKRRRRRA